MKILQKKKTWAELLGLFLFSVVSWAIFFFLPEPDTGSSLVWILIGLSGSSSIIVGFSLVIVLVITSFSAILCWIRLTRKPFTEKFQLTFEEHWMECSSVCECSRYFYSYIQSVSRTKHGLYIYMANAGNAKAVLCLPSSCFINEEEKEQYVRFLEDKRMEKQNLTAMAEGSLSFFTFVQKPEDWIDVLVKAKFFAIRSKYWYKTPEGYALLFTLGSIIFMSGILISKKPPGLLSALIYIMLVFTIYQIYFRRKSIQKQIEKLRRKGRLQPNRIGHQAVAFGQSSLGFYSDSEQFYITYPQIQCAVETGHDVFIFSKGSVFINIPIWVFQGKEKQDLYEFLQSKGVDIQYKEI